MFGYSRERKVAGEQVGSFQFIQRRLADAEVGSETLRWSPASLRYLADGVGRCPGGFAGKDDAAKTLLDVAAQAGQIYGSYGLQEGWGCAKVLLDAVTSSIAGTPKKRIAKSFASRC